MEKLQQYLALKNGSDVRGVALGCCGLPVTLTAQAVKDIAAAFAVWVGNRTQKERPVIAVGHDSRLSAEALTQCVTDGIAERGGKIVLTGLSSTPSMYAFLKTRRADASVMVTASHLPKDRNGLKFFLPEGGLEGTEVEEVLRLAARLSPAESFPREVSEHPFLAEYAAGLVELVRKATGEQRPLEGMRVIVDAGNGAGGFYVQEVLSPLGADTEGSQFLDPDGNFPNHIPNPENAAAMRSVCEAVVRSHADFGIIFDTDVDRAGAVSARGEEINRNRLIALVSAILLGERKGAYIVTDSVTSDGLTSFIEERGGVHHRFKRGYKNVINEAKRLNAEGKYAPLAIETSGHAALSENDFLDDGAYLVTRLLIALAREKRAGRSLTSLIDGLPEALEAEEVRLEFAPGCDFKTLGEQVIGDFRRFAQETPHLRLASENYEGARVNFGKECGDGWLLVRMSLHEPILPVNAESNSRGGVRRMLGTLLGFLRQYPFLQLEKLEKIIKE